MQEWRSPVVPAVLEREEWLGFFEELRPQQPWQCLQRSSRSFPGLARNCCGQGQPATGQRPAKDQQRDEQPDLPREIGCLEGSDGRQGPEGSQLQVGGGRARTSQNNTSPKEA